MEYEKIPKQNYKYRLTQAYACQLPKDFAYISKSGIRLLDSSSSDLDVIASIGEEDTDGCRMLTLNPGFAWNGSNVVPDTPACMRASAVHDALCQLMELDRLPNIRKNWGAAARLYRKMCQEDGMTFMRRNIRCTTLEFWGFLSRRD